MKRSKRFRAASQIEIDLCAHLATRVMQSVVDFGSTAKVAGIKPDEAAVLAICVLLDSAFAGMDAAELEFEEMRDLMVDRMDKIIAKHSGRKK